MSPILPARWTVRLGASLATFALALLVQATCACTRAGIVRAAEAGAVALDLAEPVAAACVARYRSGEPVARVDVECLPLARALSSVRASVLALRAAVAAYDAGRDADPSTALAALARATADLAAAIAAAGGEP